jgi:hypothetical protein
MVAVASVPESNRVCLGDPARRFWLELQAMKDACQYSVKPCCCGGSWSQREEDRGGALWWTGWCPIGVVPAAPVRWRRGVAVAAPLPVPVGAAGSIVVGAACCPLRRCRRRCPSVNMDGRRRLSSASRAACYRSIVAVVVRAVVGR